MENDSSQVRQGTGARAQSVGVFATASVAAFLAAGCGLLYSISFVVLARVSSSQSAPCRPAW